VGIDAKINDQMSGAVRIATGNSGQPRSTNQTLENSFEKHPIWIDQAFLDWKTPIPENIGKADIIGGKFVNPFNTTELMWDGDINPEGVAMKYTSPSFDVGGISANLYGNGGGFWMLNSIDKLDVYMIGVQGGLKVNLIKDWAGVWMLPVPIMTGRT